MLKPKQITLCVTLLIMAVVIVGCDNGAVSLEPEVGFISLGLRNNITQGAAITPNYFGIENFPIGPVARDHTIIANDPDTESMMSVITSVITPPMRNVMPPMAGLPAGFSSFTLEFTGIGASTGTNLIVHRTFANLSNQIPLRPGNYDLTVTAFLDAPGTLPGVLVAARGTSVNIEIAPADITHRTVTLRTILDEGSGTFEWDIGLPLAIPLTRAIMQVSTPGGTSVFSVPDLSADNSRIGNTTLPSGQYMLSFLLERDGEGLEPISWQQVLHIYRNMTSRISYNFTEDHFGKTFHTVTFVYNEGDFFWDNGYAFVFDGERVLAPNLDPFRPLSRIRGWSTTQDRAPGTEFDFDTSITGDLTLYAVWELVDGYPGLDIVFEDPTFLILVSANGNSLSESAIPTGNIRNLTHSMVVGEETLFEVTNATDLTGITWTLGESQIGVGNQIGAGPFLNFTRGEHYSSVGRHFLTVRALREIDGVLIHYSRTIELTIRMPDP